MREATGARGPQVVFHGAGGQIGDTSAGLTLTLPSSTGTAAIGVEDC
jgi:hypothetical protein